MRDKQPAYLLFVRDWDSDEATRLMTDSEAGLFVRALNHAWTNYGLPPDPDEIMAALPGKRTRKSFHRDWPRVAACFMTGAELAANSDGSLAELAMNSNVNRLFNAKQEQQRLGQKAFSHKQSETAKSGWDKRKARLGSQGEDGGDSIRRPGNSDATALPTQAQTHISKNEHSAKGNGARVSSPLGNRGYRPSADVVSEFIGEGE